MRSFAKRLGTERLFSQRLSVVKLTLSSRANCSCEIFSSLRTSLSVSSSLISASPHSKNYSIHYSELQEHILDFSLIDQLIFPCLVFDFQLSIDSLDGVYGNMILNFRYEYNYPVRSDKLAKIAKAFNRVNSLGECLVFQYD